MRSDIEEKEHIIEALKTKVTLLKVSFISLAIWQLGSFLYIQIMTTYRMTIHVVPNLPLTSKQKFCFSRRPIN